MTPRMLSVTLLCCYFAAGCCSQNQEIFPDREIVLSLVLCMPGGLTGGSSRVGAPEETANLPPMRFAGILQNNSGEDMVIFDEFCFDGWGALSIQLERKNRLINISRIAWPGPSSVRGITTIRPGESVLLPVPLIPSLWDKNIAVLLVPQPDDRVRIKLQLRFTDGRMPKVIESNFIPYGVQNEFECPGALRVDGA